MMQVLTLYLFLFIIKEYQLRLTAETRAHIDENAWPSKANLAEYKQHQKDSMLNLILFYAWMLIYQYSDCVGKECEKNQARSRRMSIAINKMCRM